MRRRRERIDESSVIQESSYEPEQAQVQTYGFRRSINKSIKQEMNEGTMRKESVQRTEKPGKQFNIKAEATWAENKPNRNAFKSKSEIPSILQTTVKESSKMLKSDDFSDFTSLDGSDADEREVSYVN